MIFHRLAFNRIPGWFDYDDIYRMFVESAFPGDHLVELGSFAGRSAAFMAMAIKKSGKKLRFDCIDHWLSAPDGPEYSPGEPPNVDRFPVFRSNLTRAGLFDYVTPVQLWSGQAKDRYADESLHAVYIDGCHLYNRVRADLEYWYPKVKPGGLFGGHDYDDSDVRRAVDEFLPPVQTSRRSWWFTKPRRGVQ